MMQPVLKTRNHFFAAVEKVPPYKTAAVEAVQAMVPVQEKIPNRHVQVYSVPDWMHGTKDWQPAEEQRANEGSQSQPDLFQVPAT